MLCHTPRPFGCAYVRAACALTQRSARRNRAAVSICAAVSFATFVVLCFHAKTLALLFSRIELLPIGEARRISSMSPFPDPAGKTVARPKNDADVTVEELRGACQSLFSEALGIARCRTADRNSTPACAHRAATVQPIGARGRSDSEGVRREQAFEPYSLWQGPRLLPELRALRPVCSTCGQACDEPGRCIPPV